jgi:hypothetical protein
MFQVFNVYIQKVSIIAKDEIYTSGFFTLRMEASDNPFFQLNLLGDPVTDSFVEKTDS